MDQALGGIPADPEPDRGVWVLASGADEHDHGHHHERRVPHDVQRDHGLGVAPVGAPLLELPRGRLPYQHGGAAPPRGPAEEDREGGRAGHGVGAVVGAALAGSEERGLGVGAGRGGRGGGRAGGTGGGGGHGGGAAGTTGFGDKGFAYLKVPSFSAGFLHSRERERNCVEGDGEGG